MKYFTYYIIATRNEEACLAEAIQTGFPMRPAAARTRNDVFNLITGLHQMHTITKI
jgi:hypothetical protein